MCRKHVVALIIPFVFIAGCVVYPIVERARCVNMPETFSVLLQDERNDLEHKRRVHCVTDIDKAMELFDNFLLPTLEDKSVRRVRRMKNRIAARMSCVYFVDGVDDVEYYLLNVFPESRCGRYGFNYLVCNLSKKTGAYDPLGENHGFLKLRGSDGLFEGGQSGYAYEKICKRFPRVMELIDNTSPCWGFEGSDVVAIIDVVDVQLMNVGGFDRVCLYPTCDEECFADFSVRMDIRAVEKGAVGADSLMLTARRSWSNFGCGSWLYYRGMTLRIGLQKIGSEYLLVNISPVVPYEPFSAKDVSVSGGFRVGKDWKEMQEGKLSPLTVQYGNHTKVEFLHGEIINCGKRGSFPDFGVTASVKVVELSEDGGNEEYWEDAWFVKIDE